MELIKFLIKFSKDNLMKVGLIRKLSMNLQIHLRHLSLSLSDLIEIS